MASVVVVCILVRFAVVIVEPKLIQGVYFISVALSITDQNDFETGIVTVLAKYQILCSSITKTITQIF